MMPETNLHTHTYRCHHATGEDRAYVEEAIRAGVRVLGFADHSPILYPADSNFCSCARMRPDEYEGYVQSVLDLKQEYRDDIEIHLGAELEYLPALFSDTLAFLCAYPIEYLLLGQHYVGNEYDAGSLYTGKATDDPTVLRRYVDQTIAGLRTGAFTYLAHPDTIHFTGDSDLFLAEMTPLLKEAKRLGIPVEANFLGFREHRHYPRRDLWELVREIGNEVVIGFDAHTVETFRLTREMDELRAWLASLSLSPLMRIPLRDPHDALASL